MHLLSKTANIKILVLLAMNNSRNVNAIFSKEIRCKNINYKLNISQLIPDSKKRILLYCP